MSLSIPLLVQLLECIQLVYKVVSSYYYIVITLYILFFKSNRDFQILFIFQFSKLLSSQRTYPRPISNSLYRCSVPYITGYIRSLIQFLFLLYKDSLSKFLYGFFCFLPYKQIFKVFLLLNLGLFNSLYLYLKILVLQDS